MQELKEKGNEFFKRGDHQEAYKLYTQALELAEKDESVDKSQLHLIYSNRAATLLSLERYQEALEDCEKVLALDPKFLKGHLRKAMALNKLGQLNKALEAAEAGLAIDKNPKTVAVPELLNLVKSIRAELKRRVSRKSAQETEELVKDYNDVVAEVERLNYELETRDRDLKSMKLTLSYVNQVQTETGEIPKTYLPVGRMYLRKPADKLKQELETRISTVTEEFTALQNKMRSNETKLKTMSQELEEILRANQ